MIKLFSQPCYVNQVVWFHDDIDGDVLYLRLGDLPVPSYSEETPDGFLLSRALETDEVTGLTIVNWWKRFGAPGASDSLLEIEKRVEPLAQKLAA